MPYIEQKERDLLDPFINVLAHHMNLAGPGEFTYIVYRLALRYLGPNPRFAACASVIGCLQAVVLELYRTVIGPYEERKRALNGDVTE